MRQELLPLFPLHVVLFPTTPISLHIFEERYKEMIGESIENRSEFGIVLASEKGIVNTGCTAVVERLVKKYPDGRMDIIAVGRRRFEILTLDDERSYLRGAVEFFDDDEDARPASDETRRKALEGYQALARLDSDTPELDSEIGESGLSFQLAQAVPDLNMRQMLLVLRSEADRIQRLADYFPGLLDRQKHAARMRELAGSNGHAKRPAGV
jgi:Lon protease-like protein